MAHFVVVIGEKEWLLNTEQLEVDTEEMVKKAGQTCVVWRPETRKKSINLFLKEGLSRDEPVALVYMGHGSKYGWGYEKAGFYPYLFLARHIAGLRQNTVTAIINSCCHSGAITHWLGRTTFNRRTTIALTAGIADRTSVAGESLKEDHTYRVFQAWFEKREAFNPFLFNDNIRDVGDEEETTWEHWRREGPERFGPTTVDKYFFARS